MAIRRFTVDYNTLIDPGSVCTNPTISYSFPRNITVPCSDSNSVDIEINTDIPGPYCLTFVIDCTDSCSSCGTIVRERCFCIDPDDCGDCENCTGNLCVSTCLEGKVCDNDHCVGCTDDGDCLCNQECNQGGCGCPVGLKKRADGCCVECFDDEDLGNCLVCDGGVITAKNCPNGHCNPTTGDCSECLNNDHCQGPNECCGGAGKCECCPGFILDPVTDECVPAPPCTSAAQCQEIYGLCSYCTANGCAPKVCPAGQVCDPNTGECVPGCTDGTCPEGYGCLHGRCVPCSELSCTGSGELCEYASGCHCVGINCEYIDCNPELVDLVWGQVPGTPGTQTSPGLPALQGTINITPNGIVYLQPPTGAGYMDHTFNLSVNGTSGQWTLYHNPSNSIPLGSGTSISFSLSGTAQNGTPNLVGFLVKFVEAGTGRTSTWAVYRTPTAPLVAPNVWNSEYSANGVPPSYSGGTPGSFKLCSTNGNFKPTGVTNVVTTGTLSISFVSDGANCLIAHVTGCGTWNGDVVLSCGGTIITVAAPELSVDPANCCDPANADCGGWGTGEPCTGVNIVPITLVALPTYGLAGSGDGEFMISADWTSAGLSFFDLFYLDPSDGCWSTNNANGGDATIVASSGASPFGPSLSNLSTIVTMGDGGCVRLGYTCELRIPGCRKLQGEICLTECQEFTVSIVDLGSNTYKALPSTMDEVVSFEWSYPGLVNNTGQTVTITPIGGSSTLTVIARYGSPTKCTATAQLTFSVSMPGCTNRFACNYSATATLDDGSCVLIGDPGYDCKLGGFQPGLIDANKLTLPLITYSINGNLVTTNTPLNPGDYIVNVLLNGVNKCNKTLRVPQCYNCVGTVCTPAPLGNNIGRYQGDAACGQGCNNNIQINIIENCVNNGTVLVITATGGSGVYTVTVDKVGGSQVVPPTTLLTSGTLSTPVLPNGLYRVVVTDGSATNSRDYFANCHDCSEDTTALSNITSSCTGNYSLTYTITADQFASFFTVQLLDYLGVPVPGRSMTWTGPGTYGHPLGAYPGDGQYTLRITDDLGCSKDYALDLNCNGTLQECPIISASMSYSAGSTGYDNLTAVLDLSESGGTYTVQFYNTTGGGAISCASASLATPIGSPIAVTGVSGPNTVNYPDAITAPGVPTCYGAVISRSGAGYETCQETVFVLVEPDAAPACSGSVTNATYNTATGQTLVSWDFQNTSDSLTVRLDAYASGTCNSGSATTVTSTGNGENGTNIPFLGINQLPGVTQCVKVTVFDENNPTCTATTSFTLPGCTCQITLQESDVVINPGDETADITFTTRCTVNGNVNIDISGDATGSSTITNASTDGTVDTHTVTVALTAYTSTGGTINVELTDDDNGACTITVPVDLPGNCVGCAQIATFSFGDSVVTSIVDIDSNTVVSGSYDMAQPAQIAALEADIRSELIGLGANFCDEGGVDVGRTGGYSGVKVSQDSTDYKDLNYAMTTNAAWVGAKPVFFGDCGCNIGRLCTYSTTIDLSNVILLDSFIDIFITYGLNAGVTYSNTVTLDLGDTTDGISPSEIAALETQLKNALENAAGCNYTVGEVNITFVDTPGSESMTIEVVGTNAGLGVGLASFVDGLASAEYFSFTQSACS